MYNFIRLTKDYKEEWDAFNEGQEKGNIFQSFNYYELLLSERNYKPFAYGLLENGEISGLIVGTIESNLIFPINHFTRRAIIRGGPLIKDDDPERLRFLLKNFLQIIKSKCIYIQIRNLWSTKDYRNALEDYKFNYIPYLDIIVNLQKDKENLIADISKNKRGNVNKSKNKGTMFNEIVDESEYNKAISLIKTTYKRVRLPLPTDEFFRNAFEKLSSQNYLRVFAAYKETEMIGVRLELCFNNLVYDWYAGSHDKYKNRYPNDFLPYNILLWGKENNFSRFDFGGAGIPGIPYGVREHKMKFGGEIVEYGRYQRINNNIIYNAGKFFFRLLGHSKG